MANKIFKTVFVFNDETNVNAFGVDFEAITTSKVFIHRMDVWIIPKKSGFDILRTKGLNTINATGSATGMKQEFHLINYSTTML